MYTISFRFAQELEPVSLAGIESGQTLLEIALANGVQLNHNCGGICSCTTCHVYVENGMKHFEKMNRREEDYLKRVKNTNANSRLACQLLLLEGENDIDILVPVQTEKGIENRA